MNREAITLSLLREYLNQRRLRAFAPGSYQWLVVRAMIRVYAENLRQLRAGLPGCATIRDFLQWDEVDFAAALAREPTFPSQERKTRK